MTNNGCCFLLAGVATAGIIEVILPLLATMAVLLLLIALPA